MKKIALGFLALCCCLYSLALDNSSVKENLGSVRSSEKSPKNSSKSIKVYKTSKHNLTKRNTINVVKGKKENSINKKNSVCHVCCTFTSLTPDGQSTSHTACAGWFLMGCEAAGERACERARMIAIIDFVF
jgi:hypothetical protein